MNVLIYLTVYLELVPGCVVYYVSHHIMPNPAAAPKGKAQVRSCLNEKTLVFDL